MKLSQQLQHFRHKNMQNDFFATRQQPKTLSHSRSSMSLNQLKKNTQNNPLLKTNIQSQQTLARPSKSRGNLRMGSVAKPSVILPKQLRKDPFHKASQFTEELLTKKGLCELVSMGVISKQVDCYQLLNMRYQLQYKPDPSPTFLTNPAILISTYYQVRQGQQSSIPSPAPTPSHRESELQKPRTIRSSKKKVVRKQEPFLLMKESIRLSIINFKFHKNETYDQYIRQVRRKGDEVVFRMFQQKVEEMAKKYQIKKFTIQPQFNPIKKITEADIVKCIPNAKLLGIYRKLKGSPEDVLRNLVKMTVAGMRFRNLKLAVVRMEKVKSKFKIKKFYREMLNKRWEYLNFKLGAFAEIQRRATQVGTRPDVEIHLIASDLTPPSTSSYYQWQERSSAHLMRLYNNESDHLILLHHREIDLTPWLEDIEATPSSWKKPNIHLIESHLPKQHPQIPQCGQLYFGLRPESIRKIRGICSGKKTVVVPYCSSQYLPLLCEVLGVQLMGGTFTQQANALLFEQDSSLNEHEDQSHAKFKKLVVNSQQMTKYYRNRMSQIVLANSLIEKKTEVKKLFSSLKIPTPLSLGIADMNERDFFRQLVRMILLHKDQNKWILKLPNSSFSRGLALLETDSLKILKQNKKKTNLTEEDIDHIAKIMEYILVQKVFLPHNSLLTGEDFMASFKMQGGYIESFIDSTSTVCFFGRIEFNGLFTLLGSYKKYFAEMVCFGAVYPGMQLTESLKAKLAAIGNALYRKNVFGYLTIQAILDGRGQLSFIDIVPHLQPFSQLYFYYKRLLDINEIDGNSAALSRTLLYCPFLDNNGNKTQSLLQFQQTMNQKKIKFDYEQKMGTRFWGLAPNSASVMAMLVCGKDEGWVLREALEALTAVVEIGGPFNKFAKGVGTTQCDGLYMLDIIWRLRQLKKDMQ